MENLRQEILYTRYILRSLLLSNHKLKTGQLVNCPTLKFPSPCLEPLFNRLVACGYQIEIILFKKMQHHQHYHFSTKHCLTNENLLVCKLNPKIGACLKLAYMSNMQKLDCPNVQTAPHQRDSPNITSKFEKKLLMKHFFQFMHSNIGNLFERCKCIVMLIKSHCHQNLQFFL